MNFENYNKIYKEILDDENGELSANYLLNKYEIKHDEELLNILNQIKKNEYISSENKVINRIISELDSNENLLDINEIINIKDKVIDLNNFDDEIEQEIQESASLEEIIEDKSKNNNRIENTGNEKKKKYGFYAAGLILVVGSYFVLNTNTNEETKKEIDFKAKEDIINTIPLVVKKSEKLVVKEKKILEKKVEVRKEEKKIEEKEIEIEITKKAENITNDIKLGMLKEKLNEEKIKKNVVVLKSETKKIVENNSNSEDTLNKLEKSIIKKVESKEKVVNKDISTISSLKVGSLDQVSKYLKELKYKNNSISFRGKSYIQGDTLFGFKVFKLTPIYVKLEDTKKRIRKRFTFKK